MTHVIAYVFAYLNVCANVRMVPQVFIAKVTGIGTVSSLQ